ncbi:hypothetical protein SDC9_21346 [bioreactor metagenome]|uniref:Uncharacterized protein n=1 Tax=bioreactor metagenome TaxID=1076179 RepID=A0A644U9N3_9ZZZZ
MARRGEQIRGRPLLDDPARLHHQTARGDGTHHRQVVRDEEIGEPMVRLQPGEQGQNLRPHPHIERRDRLVEHDQPRPDDQRAGDGKALSLTAREFVDVAVAVFGREADIAQRGIDPGLGIRRAAGQVERLGDQPRHCLPRIEGAVGILEHHLHRGALRGRHARRDRRAGERDAPARERIKAEDGAGQGRLAAARFAHQPERFAGVESEGDAIDRMEFGGWREKRGPGQAVAAARVFDPQQGVGVGFRVFLPGKSLRCFSLVQILIGQRGKARGGQKGAGIGPGGGAEERLGRPLLYDPAVLHHRDAGGHLRGHGKVVGDEQQRHAFRAHEVAQQRQHLGLGGDIERGGGLVGDQQLRAQRDGQRDRHALALAARKLVREKRQREARCGQADAVKAVAGDAAGLAAGKAAVDDQRLGHLIADRHQRVERGHRLLKDHPHAGAAQPAQLAFGKRGDLAPGQPDRAGAVRALGQEPHHRQRRHRLARARFADKAEDLARLKVQRDVAQHLGRADADAEAPDRKQAHVSRPRSRGSSASRSPSPRRLSPNTVSTIASPGNSATCGAIATIVCASASIRPQLAVGGCAPRPT